MADKQPVFVCVHGASHGSWNYGPLAALLSPAGFRIAAVDLPSCVEVGDDRGPIPDMEGDVEAVCSALRSELGKGNDVIAVAHSYGGFITSEAVGRVVAEQKNQPAGAAAIKWIVYIAAWPMVENMSVVDFRAEAHKKAGDETAFPFWDMGTDGFAVPNDQAGAYFFGGLPEDQQGPWVKLLRKQAVPPFASATTVAPGHRSVPSTFVHTADDTVIPEPVQRAAVEHAISTAKGVGGLAPFSDPDVGVKLIKTGHAPLLSATEEVKDILLAVAKKATAS